MQTEILLYDAFDEMDAVGPYETLVSGGFDVALVTNGPADRVEGGQGLVVVPHRELSERPELLIVPGGSWTARNPDRGAWAEVQRGVLPPVIAARHAAGSTVASVCTGAFLLEAAGLLDGRPAVTHREDLDDLEKTGARVIRDARVVDDGDVLTSGGVTAGLDLALWLIEREKGPEALARAENHIEHSRAGRLWRAGTPMAGSSPPAPA
jgi:transcriptional regulator GlxA family with amidase domain